MAAEKVNYQISYNVIVIVVCIPAINISQTIYINTMQRFTNRILLIAVYNNSACIQNVDCSNFELQCFSLLFIFRTGRQIVIYMVS